MNVGLLLIVLGIAVAMFVHSGLGAFMVLLGVLLLVIPALRV